jgi:hypothetical protein
MLLAFMTLSENPNLGGWTGHTIFRSLRVELNIDAEMWEVGPQQAAKSALEAIEQRWPEIDGALQGHPLKLYNESWANPTQDFPALAASQFLERLLLTSVAIGQGAITLNFSDGNLFAGHTVAVTLLGDQEPTAMIEG